MTHALTVSAVPGAGFRFDGINVDWSHVPDYRKDGERVVEFAGEVPPDPRALPRNQHMTTHKQSLAMAMFDVGGKTRPHMHPDCDETYVVQMGMATVWIGEPDGKTVRKLAVSTADTIIIPAGHPHHMVNTGHTPVGVAVMCSPPWRVDRSVDAPEWFAKQIMSQD
jgi:mannose-6-phosphate isomerase-like protein (cupin superfamily)